MQNMTYYDISKFPRVILPVRVPELKRNRPMDKYGVPGRRPTDWLYERSKYMFIYNLFWFLRINLGKTDTQ
jgi:hypothetical protein